MLGLEPSKIEMKRWVCGSEVAAVIGRKIVKKKNIRPEKKN